MRLHRLTFDAVGADSGAQGPSVAVARQPALSLVPAPRPDVFARFDGGLGAAQGRRRTLLAMAGLHVLVIAGLLAATRGHETIAQATPLILSLVTSPAPAPAPTPLPPPPQHTLVLPRLDVPLIAPEPSPSPSPLVAQAVAPTPPAPAAVEAPPAPPAPAPAPAPAARMLPASGVQFLVPPAPVYSTMSRRMNEAGKVVVRVYVDEQGLPHEVQVSQSSGFARLDDSAVAAVKKVRFKPYVENGVAFGGWAFIPIEFTLDK